MRLRGIRQAPLNRPLPRRFEQPQINRRPKTHRRGASAAAGALDIARRGLPLPEVRRGLFFPGPEAPGHRANLIMAPNLLSVTTNYRETVGFIYEQRHRYYVNNAPVGGGRPRLAVVDLEKVQTVDLGGMTALVAEYQRQIRENHEFRPYINDGHWDPYIRSLLSDFGFYTLVRALNEPNPGQGWSDMACVPFKAYDLVDGEQVDPLIDELKAIAGRAPKRIATYNALMEATKNVKNHAYPEDLFEERPDPPAGLWWAAGAYFRHDDVLEFVVYDQGVGIAQTLKRRSFWESIVQRCPPEFNDADVIAGAIDLGRTSTGKLERGNGLWTICRLVEELPGSQVRLISGRGDVVYASDGTVTKKPNDNPFCGTLIHWKLALSKDPEVEVQP